MAAISVLCNNALYYRPFAYSLNYTDHDKHIVEEIKSLSKVYWFKAQTASFGKFSSAPFAEVLTVRGAAFSFNILNFSDLLNTKT